MDAGMTGLWGVERDPAIAAWNDRVIGGCLPSDVCHIDYSGLARPDLLWASPPCQNHSTANQRKSEGQEDVAAAAAVCRALHDLLPPYFILENVRQYRKSESLPLITRCLDALGYTWDATNVNAADFGVPQTRQRLIVRATLARSLPPYPAPEPWTGWWSAVCDLDLPDGKLGDWQIARLPAEVREALGGSSFRGRGACLLDVKNTGRMITVRQGDQPAFTVLASVADSPCHVPAAMVPRGWRSGRDYSVVQEMPSDSMQEHGRPSSCLIGGLLASGGKLTIRTGSEPANTVCASAYRRPTLACLPEWRVVRMTPRALARFQSVPDWYDLPDDPKLATKIVGNGVPSLLACRLAEGMMDLRQRKAA